ncbi:lipopolysaccharide assembly protein LapB [Paraferrimonas sp. SM1919]|uniref:lipopolysaccharide assembly protein LapB n=1 Tax=Paraferrimonas sp. SM1919 TaxID=2662263 RepID=UPI0013D3EA10|nr:lipopolysaccharide assembly protein LapB [Paraferrimonas sp. SM1919]
MFELVFLLLPIAVAYGWFMGRRSVSIAEQNQQKKRSKNYFNGLNYLLTQEADKAVDLFINLLEVDDDTIDTHMSLAALFRHKGEVERAIRIHQNIMTRPQLSIVQRDFALLELGRDYVAAGFYDRAEQTLVSLIEQDEHTLEAEKELLAVYQVTKEWQKAINIILGMSKQEAQEFTELLAHFYCEQADQEQTVKTKVKRYQQALVRHPECSRAILALAEHYFSTNDLVTAITYSERLLSVDPSIFNQLLNIISRSNIDNQSLIKLLENAVSNKAGVSAVLLLVEQYLKLNKQHLAEELILRQLKKHPTLKGFKKLMDLFIDKVEEGKTKHSLELLSQLVEQQINSHPKFSCRNCGFEVHSLYWHCPSCHSWSTIKPVTGLNGE